MGALAPRILSGWIDELAVMDLYVGLVSSDPLLVSDPLAVEVTSPSYVRELVDFNRVSATALLLVTSVVFDSLDIDTRVAGVAIWDAQYNGHLVARDMLKNPADFPAGGSYTVAAGGFTLGLDITGL